MVFLRKRYCFGYELTLVLALDLPVDVLRAEYGMM